MSYITQWVTKPLDLSGDHLKLAYDQVGTWNVKYNGYPDKLLGSDLPPKCRAQEAEVISVPCQHLRVPLDPRHTYTKSD